MKCSNLDRQRGKKIVHLFFLLNGSKVLLHVPLGWNAIYFTKNTNSILKSRKPLQVRHWIEQEFDSKLFIFRIIWNAMKIQKKDDWVWVREKEKKIKGGKLNGNRMKPSIFDYNVHVWQHIFIQFYRFSFIHYWLNPFNYQPSHTIKLHAT